MQKSIIRIDWYTKSILTVIAVLLLGILIKPSISPQKAEASSVEYVYVENSRKNPIRVEIVSGRVEVYGPVEVDGTVEVSSSWDFPSGYRGQ